jgi:hypothetical protein
MDSEVEQGSGPKAEHRRQDADGESLNKRVVSRYRGIEELPPVRDLVFE